MKYFVESFARGDEAAEASLKYYLAVVCDGCKSKGFIPRTTVNTWKGKRTKTLVFASPSEREALRAAARHRFVDVVSFGGKTLRYLDESEVLLVLQGGKGIEIRINEVLERWKSLNDLKRVVNLLLNKWVPTLLTCSPSSRYELCHPFQIISLIATLGYKEEDVAALWGLGSSWLISLIERKMGMKKVLRSD
ncbi:hypothetical protein IPA_04015 [Ignicoccus pacificus DSM 13166]|uniref:Uncharacterized protein n=1 Tax=Ignicoccus pacificus DSM 13166 TaxID=940294 RepID=A0A977KB10_9CREN|nr:hypothetical protein IPA_04015 [Ignicoccus pacificus DSM 13166]